MRSDEKWKLEHEISSDEILRNDTKLVTSVTLRLSAHFNISIAQECSVNL